MYDYNHMQKITDTYLEILKKFAATSEPNMDLLKNILDLYAYAYEAGEREERDRYHLFFREAIDEEELVNLPPLNTCGV